MKVGEKSVKTEPIGSLRRTHTCDELRSEHDGQTVTLMGWVHRRRDLGGLIFIDLRDRYGMTQVVVDPAQGEAFEKAERVRSEFVLAVIGRVRVRPGETRNANINTGDVELVVEEIKILNPSKVAPVQVSDYQNVDEALRQALSDGLVEVGKDRGNHPMKAKYLVMLPTSTWPDGYEK